MQRQNSMLFLLSKAMWVVGRPSTILFVLTLAGAVTLLRARSSRAGFALLFAGVAGLAACSLLPLGTWLLSPLENRFPLATVIREPVDGIILLGGAIDVSTSVDRGSPALNIRAERIEEFVALARRFPRAQLVFTGGNASVYSSHTSEAQVMRTIASVLDCPSSK